MDEVMAFTHVVRLSNSGFFCDDDDGFFYQKPFHTEN